MRIPHIIGQNTLLAYAPSPDSLNLVGEDGRTLTCEDFEWNKDHCPTLVDYCVEAICKYFKDKPLLNELPCGDRVHLLEILKTDLPLELCIPHIQDEFYWQRRYKDQFGLVHNTKPKFWTWKSLYLERHIQDILEQAQPQYNDEETFDEILTLCSQYVKRVYVTQLQAWKPPLTMDKEDIPEVYPTDHINFSFIFRKLPLITEFDLIFGMNNIAENFNWNMFKVSIADCQKLGKALIDLKQLKILRIHRSNLEYKHCQALLQGLIKNRSLEELDLSNCEIGDSGALCVAKFLGQHPTLKILKLENNKIGKIGAEGLGFTLCLTSCAPLEVLNLRLNPLGKDGAMGIMRALVRSDKPKELSMSGCLFEDDTHVKISQMIRLNESLKKLDISNNWFGEAGGEGLVAAMDINTTLEYLDSRYTDITTDQQQKIRKFLLRNRTGLLESDKESGEGEELEEEEEVIINTDFPKDEEGSPE